MKVHQIRAGLYVRGNTLRLPRQTIHQAAGELGLTMVISLWRWDQNMAEAVREYVWQPLSDSGRFDWWAAEELADRAAQEIREGGTVLIQCHAGRNRACAVAALVVMKLDRRSGDQAVSLVRQRRPNALSTPFLEYYLRYRTSTFTTAARAANIRP